MLDIVFFLFVIIFFVFKLKSSFGLRNEDDEKRRKTIEEFFRQKYSQEPLKNNSSSASEFDDNIIDITNTNVVKKDNDEIKLSFNVSDEIKAELIKIGFNEDNFLKGVESALEMINEAFSNKDANTLKEILSKQLFINFKKQMDELAAQNKILKSSLISVLSKNINGIMIANNNIFINVLLKTEQINFIENDKHEVIQGSKKKIEVIKEKWTFSRSLNSKVNFWIVENIVSMAND